MIKGTGSFANVKRHVKGDLDGEGVTPYWRLLSTSSGVVVG